MTEKLSKQQREQLKQYVKESIIFRLTAYEALEYIEEKLGVSISRRYYFYVKRYLEVDAQRWIIKNFETRGVYLRHFHEQVDVVKFLQKNMWEIYHNEKTKDNDRIDAINVLTKLEEDLVTMYNTLLPRVYAYEQHLEVEEQGRQQLLHRFDNKINFTEEEKRAMEDKEKMRVEAAKRSKEYKF